MGVHISLPPPPDSPSLWTKEPKDAFVRIFTLRDTVPAVTNLCAVTGVSARCRLQGQVRRSSKRRGGWEDGGWEEGLGSGGGANGLPAFE